jgi:protein SCO1
MRALPSSNSASVRRAADISAPRAALLTILAGILLAGSPGSPAQGVTHEHHQPAARTLRVSTAEYAVPDVWLLRQDGKKVSLGSELDDGRPVVLNFIFTTCPGICPLMSHTFSQFQDQLGVDRNRVHMMSISIDPEQDTPSRLRAYAQQFSAGSQWDHYTGTVAASVAAQKAFDAYRGDKMAHAPLTLMRAAPGKPWLRLDGFASSKELFERFASLTSSLERAPNTALK